MMILKEYAVGCELIQSRGVLRTDEVRTHAIPDNHHHMFGLALLRRDRRAPKQHGQEQAGQMQNYLHNSVSKKEQGTLDRCREGLSRADRDRELTNIAWRLVATADLNVAKLRLT